MSWMQKLYETYENCAALGIVGMEPLGGDEDKPKASGVLLPIAHTVLKAHITVDLDAHGNLLGARAQQDTAGTISPCTEDSESRSSTMAAPHPLFDKLQYLAGDYGGFTGQDNRRYFLAYLNQLENWLRSPHSHPKVEAMFRYLQRGALTADLVEKKVLFTGGDGRLLDKWEGGKDTAPDIFKIPNCTPSKAIVRFTVNIPGEHENRVWMDESVRQSFITYTLWQQQEKRLCYVTGNVMPYIEKHPKKIVNTLANAKLISANDNTGFTYRGRFSESEQAVSVGYDTSLKAHNALRWLVERGKRFDTKTIVAWDTGNRPLPSPVDGGDELFGEETTCTAADLLMQADARTERRYADELGKALASLGHDDLGNHGDVVVLALDSATVGRLSITYYRELRRGEYLERVTRWHETCVWLIPGRNNEEKRSYVYLGAPSSWDIATSVYGKDGSDKLKKAVPERLLACIFDGAKLPDDIVSAAVRRASNPAAFEYWGEWNKTLSVACALYRKKHEEEGYDLALDENRTDRSYLFGRLLAVADQIERWALAGEDRETNAMRYMNAFSKKPVETWRVISERLRPYQGRLKGKASHLNDLITKITDSFEPGQFDKRPEEPLTGAYLLGYHNQRQVFLNERAERKKKIDEAKLRGQQINEEELDEE